MLTASIFLFGVTLIVTHMATSNSLITWAVLCGLSSIFFFIEARTRNLMPQLHILVQMIETDRKNREEANK
jgi:hypothetical protein